MESVMENLGARIDKFEEQDKERTELLRTVQREYDEFKGRIKKLEFELAHEKESRLRYQTQLHDILGEKNKLNSIVDKDPFVTVLVDGDGAIFRDEFLRDPAQGAREAALSLQREVRNYLNDTSVNSDNVTVLVRIFVNLHGLATKMRSLDIIQSENDMRMFAVSFNNSRAEFDLVNVGNGKENADSKMRKMLSHYLKNFQCKKIFFAGCHDSGYRHDLSEYGGDYDAKDRIVLLETTPAHFSFGSLGMKMTSFQSVFRSEPLENDSKNKVPSKECLPNTERPVIPTGHGASPFNSSQRHTPFDDVKVNSSGNGGHSISYLDTYATVGGRNGHRNIYIASTNTKSSRKRPEVINRNENGHRVDVSQKSFINSLHKATYMRKCADIKPKGFCNNFYLLGSCERGPSCKMDHDTKLTPEEIEVHRHQARSTLCLSGPMCERYGCYLSHHCPWESCPYGADCKFKKTPFGDLHYGKKDMEVVTQWTEDNDFPINLRRNGSLEISD